MWEKFKDETVGFRHTEAWVKSNDAVVTRQLAIRDALLANGGAAPSKPRSIADALGNYSLRA